MNTSQWTQTRCTGRMRCAAYFTGFEGKAGEALRQRRQRRAAGRAFMRRFQDLCQELLRPLLNSLADWLGAPPRKCFS